MSGRVGNLSPSQEAALKEFKTAASDVLQSDHNDAFLLRWLRARNFDVDKAETMLRKSLQWRQQFGADSLITDFKIPEVLSKYYPGGIAGHDKEGCPLWIIPCAGLDARGYSYSVKKTDLAKYVVRRFELSLQDMKQQSKKLGKVIDRHVYILDLEGFSVKNYMYKSVLGSTFHLINVYEANYPETLKKGFLINAPQLFSMLFNIFKPLLSEETREKIHIFGKDGWQEEILKVVSPEELPLHWGGTKIDSNGDPKCSSAVRPGGLVPVSDYFSSRARRLSEEKSVQKVVIEKKAEFLVEVDVDEAGSFLHWEFQTDANDIGFGVFYKSIINSSNPDNKLEEIYPVERIECEAVPESSMISCTKSGIYVLKFDNSYSWFSSKRVSYHFEVSPPEIPDIEITYL